MKSLKTFSPSFDFCLREKKLALFSEFFCCFMGLPWWTRSSSASEERPTSAAADVSAIPGQGNSTCFEVQAKKEKKVEY